MGKSVTRLYEQFQPANYDLALDLDRDNLTFSGTVTIRGKKVGRPAQRLTLHQKGLKVTTASVIKHDKKGDQTVEVSRINDQKTYDEVRIHSEAMFYPGEYSVTLDFTGEISKQMLGMYQCLYQHDGKEKKLIATQFESHHARQAFPCVDEPEAKATFDLTIITPDNGETVIANTPVAAQESKDGKSITTFETTPVMSAYLLAFVYGEMGFTESKTKNGVVVRGYATPDNAPLTAYSTEVAVKALEFFEDYFQTPYPLPKLDMIALPDFSSGAMENWGLVTYRESIMLYDETSSSIETKQICALVIAHELSHQWFGNLVTMKWWDDLWLNESFANMMEYLAVDNLYPEWDIWEQFVSHESASAKRRDSLSDVQSVKTTVNHPDEISTLFDPSIVYAKGGTLLHMLMRYIGEDAFRKGLKAYFDKHRYGNTIADDLWEALSAASGQDIGGFMTGWLTRSGYPIVEFDWTPGAATANVHQSRFLSDPTAKAAPSEAWQVPFASTQPLDQALLASTKAEVKVTADDKPLLLNHDGYSYYIPHYTQAAHLQQIVNGIKKHEVSAIDRLLLLDNYIMLQRGGQSTATELLELLPAYEDEASENVWGAVGMSIAEVRKLVELDDASETTLDTMVGQLVVKLAESLGWEDQPEDSAQTLRLRGLIVSLAAGAKVETIIGEGLERFKAFKKPSDLPASTRSLVYFCGARYGSDEDFARLIELYKTTKSADEKDEIASGLTSAKDPQRFEQLFDLLKDGTVRRQDLMHWYAWLLRNRYSRAVAWQWLQDNWTWIEQEFSSDKSYGYFARFCGGVFSRQSELDDYRAFFEDKKSIIALARDITLGDQEIVSRVAWRERNETSVIDWLAKH